VHRFFGNWVDYGGRDVPNSEKDRLAAEVADRWAEFQDGLSNKRQYPVEQFRAFWEAGKRYAEITRNDPLISPKRRRRNQRVERVPNYISRSETL
jgi:hypothetical protein